MDEQNQGVPEGEVATSLPQYKDRSNALIVFGILTIVLGCIVGLFVPLILFSQLIAAKGSGPQMSDSLLLYPIVLYGSLSIILVWLGIGSVMARRWARALLLIFSWSWLLMGIFVSVFMIFFMPKAMGNPAISQEAMVATMVVMAMILGFFFIVVPAVWMLFYNSRHVKATCEARDPVIRWTDACPLPVLGLSLWLGLCAPMLLASLVMGHGVMPFFGTFLTGVPGGIFCLILAAVWSYSAWALYKLKPQGWWMILIAMCMVTVSSLLTFSRHDVIDMYRLMHFPDSQIEQLRKSGVLKGNQMPWVTVFWTLPFVGYLFFTRKFIFRKS